MARPARIGVFGGTFDPPHVGHLVAAVNVASALELDEVLLVVAAVPWQKLGTRAISTAAHRFAMVERAAGGRTDLVASDVEIRRGGDSVTADTVEEVLATRPGADVTVVVGSDAASGMHTWRRAADLMAMASVAVVDRAGRSGGRPPAGFRTEVVPCPLVDVSSSDLRDRARRGLPIDFLVTDPVRHYIEQQSLYL